MNEQGHGGYESVWSLRKLRRNKAGTSSIESKGWSELLCLFLACLLAIVRDPRGPAAIPFRVTKLTPMFAGLTARKTPSSCSKSLDATGEYKCHRRTIW
jgi:hypothetical protein